MGGDLGPFLAEHPGGPGHREYGVVTVDHAGEPAARVREGRRVPWDYRAPGMRAWCGCGWHGEVHPQVRFDLVSSTAARREDWEREHRPVLSAMDGEWSGHVHAVLPTLRVLEVMAELRDAERALTAVVIAARTGGASWSDVAAATGTTRQAAHHRWREHDPLRPDQRPRGGRPRRPVRPADDEGARTGEDSAAEGGMPREPVAPKPAPRPGAPSDRAHVTGRRVRRLAVELTRRVDRNVEASWQGTRSRDGRYGGWSMEWSGGPTRAAMLDLAAQVAAETPGLAGLDVAGLSWWHSAGSTVDAAAATLAWLEEHPDDGAQVRYLDPEELPGWPERLPARLRARAETLVAAGWALQTAGDAADTLVRHARAGGPTAVHAWLDDLAATQDAPVVDLHTRRTL